MDILHFSYPDSLTHSSVVARLTIAEVHDVVPGVVVWFNVARLVPFRGTRHKSLQNKRAGVCIDFRLETEC